MCEKDNLLCAALLHDTLEDTETTEIELAVEFNDKIAMLVFWVSRPPNVEGNRIQRWQEYLEHYKTAPGQARVLKLADRICNLSEFHLDFPRLDEKDISFLRDVYLRESEELLDVCKGVYSQFDRSLEFIIKILKEKL